MRRVIQFTTIVFALSMLAAYVVYSQREKSLDVAPGSKSTGGSIILYERITNSIGQVFTNPVIFINTDTGTVRVAATRSTNLPPANLPPGIITNKAGWLIDTSRPPGTVKATNVQPTKVSR